MPYSHITFSNFKGLYIQPNSFGLPEGALEQANNVTISEQGVIKKRRGFYQLTSTAVTGSALTTYNSTLMNFLPASVTTLDTSTGVATTNTQYSGVSFTTASYVARTAQGAGNLFVTSDNGLMKLESPTGTVFQAGVPSALDLQGSFTGNGGIVQADSQIGYRIIFIRRDSNKNLVVSAPSEILNLANTLTSGSWSSSSSVVTVTATNTFTAGDQVYVTTVVNGSGTAVTGIGDSVTPRNGSLWTITSATTSSFVFSVSGTITGGTSGTLKWGIDRNTNLEFTIPSEIKTNDYSYQIYRSALSANASTTPYAIFRLVYEGIPTAVQLTSQIVTYQDVVADLFLGAELYTNANSRDGEAQAAERPPLAKDVCLYKNQLLLGNTTSRHKLALTVGTTGSTYLTSGTSKVTVTLGTTVRNYLLVSGVGNTKTAATATNVGSVVSVTSTAHGFSSGWQIYVSGSNDQTHVPDGFYTITGITNANVFTFSATGTPSGLTTLNIQGVADGVLTTSNRLVTLTGPTPSVSVGIQSTAKALCKAINRDTNAVIYARYVSGSNDVPGQMSFQAKGFGNAFTVTADSYTAATASTLAGGTGAAFTPNLQTSGSTVISDNSVLPNAVYVSKLGEMEAFPLLNYILVGSKNYKILRIVPLRDSVIVIKEDGVFRINGEVFTSFLSVPLDTTVIVNADQSVALLNNQVYALSNQGVVQISESAVAIVSRPIEIPLTAVYQAATLASSTFGLGYESERVYLLATLAPNQTFATIIYCYNTLTNAWSTWDNVFTNGTVGPQNTLYLVDSITGKVMKERKNQTKIDYCGQSYGPFTVVSVAADKLSAVITTGSTAPELGDVFVSATNVVSRFTSVTYSNALGQAAITFGQTVPFNAGDSVTLYSGYTSTVRLAPVTGGDIGRGKHFGPIEAHFRNSSCSRLTMYYANEKFGASENVVWATYQQGAGWGAPPFGVFAWGQEEGIQLPFGTQPSLPARTYVPQSVARSTYIQPTLIHAEAAEQLNLQALAFSVRGYGERITK